MDNLLAIADHEQGIILQPLIYEDPDFVRWLKVQRWPPEFDTNRCKCLIRIDDASEIVTTAGSADDLVWAWRP